MILAKPSPERVTAARKAAGLSLTEAAERFGMVYNAWQKKENSKGNGTKLSVGEFNYLLLLANQHPEFMVIHRPKELESSQQKAMQAACDLAQYLAAGSHNALALPTVVEAMLTILKKEIQNFQTEWRQDVSITVQNMTKPF